MGSVARARALAFISCLRGLAKRSYAYLVYIPSFPFLDILLRSRSATSRFRHYPVSHYPSPFDTTFTTAIRHYHSFYTAINTFSSDRPQILQILPHQHQQTQYTRSTKTRCVPLSLSLPLLAQPLLLLATEVTDSRSPRRTSSLSLRLSPKPAT